jgi:hypothetical protein
MERIMLKRLLSITAALALLFCGGAIAMEAMGLIFQVDSGDPERSIEAVVAKIEASLDPMDVPREAEAEGLWPPPEDRVEKHAEKQDAPVIPQPVVDLPDEEKPSAIAVSGAWTALVVAESEPEAEREALGPPEPEPMAAAETAATVPLSAPSQGAKACTGTCGAVPLAPRRGKRPRASGSTSCPLTGWMGATLLQ